MQPKPEYLDQLIEKASNAAGSDYKLAQMLETTRHAVSDWKHGRKNCPIADQVLMAEIAGLKSEEWMARALVSQYEGTSKGDKLFRALGKTLAATGTVIASSFFSTSKGKRFARVDMGGFPPYPRYRQSGLTLFATRTS